MATHRQIEANRRNALLSTGPTTDEGKAISRANALTHGLTGAGVVVADDDAAVIAERLESWRPTYRPGTDEEEWLFEQAVVSSVRVDRCQRDENLLRTHQSVRASLCWDDDRRLAAEELGATLSKKPSLVLRKLRKTRQGCDWLLERWRGLGDVLERGGEWTEAQSSLALDLLGTPRELRDGPPGSPQDLVAREVDGLERLAAEALDDLDGLERDSAETGLPIEPDRPLTLLRRYEAACMRRYQWARNRLTALRRSGQTDPVPAPPPPPVPQPAVPPPTDDQWRAYEREIFRQALARKQAASVAPEPPPIDLFDTTPDPLPSGNRQTRRAAEKLARP